MEAYMQCSAAAKLAMMVAELAMMVRAWCNA